MRYPEVLGMFLMVVSIYFCIGCKKDHQTNSLPTAPPPAFKFSTKGLDYVNLTPGKYLIYKDSATSTLDSVVVTYSQLTTTLNPANTASWFTTPAHYTQRFDLQLTKFPSAKEWFRGYANTLFSFIASDSIDVVMIGPENVPIFSSGTPPVDTLTLEGRTYTNVIIQRSVTDGSVYDPSSPRVIYYWAKGYGIIKRTIVRADRSTVTYTLLRNN